MSSNRPTGGVRDGPFVVFRNWDIPMHDIAHYPNLRGQINSLKNVTLSNLGALITAFNSDGWMKSCPHHDFSKWRRSQGIDTYVRVEYPGWYFIPGMDSVGNDISNSPMGINVAGLMVNVIVNFPEDKSARVAGFNTNGWVKTKILSTLTRSSDFPLDGLYVRTDFPGYEFYQGVDSYFGDITQCYDLINDIPTLIGACNSHFNYLGFNTNGWIKHTMTVPPPNRDPALNTPAKGAYVRMEWPGFTYLPMLDSPGNDVRQLTGKRVWELIDAARGDDEIVAFNTKGWMKKKVLDAPVEVSNDSYPLYGLYVKEPNLAALESTNIEIRPDDVNLYLFIFKGTALIWGKWFFIDSNVRAEYNKAVAYGAQKIWVRVNRRTITPLDAAREAVDMRNSYLSQIRKKPSATGLTLAQAFKPSGLPYSDILNKNAQNRYGKNFAQLRTPEEVSQVAGDAINSAGRANKPITVILKGMGYVSKGLIIIGVAVSVYQVVVADEWKFEIGRQVATWSGDITGGYLGAGVGALVGPVGAIVGGIIGGIVGGIASEGMTQLAHWFFGGRSDLSAEKILGPALLSAAAAVVKKQLTASGRNFHVHQVLPSHVMNSNKGIEVISKEMVATKSVARVDVEVVATIVWVVTPEAIQPRNGANPRDLIILMNWAASNLPLPQ